MSQLDKDLKEWVSFGLIDVEHAQRIRAHESAKPESSWILSGILILGVVVIGIGVISMIAANWHMIPDALKLGVDFLIMAALAVACIREWNKKKYIVFESLLLIFMLFCLATIGLISQVFHTGGELYEALMLWSVITFGAILASRFLFVPLIWMAAFLIGVIGTAESSGSFYFIFQKNSVAIGMMIPLLSGAMTVASKRFAGEIGMTRAFRVSTLIAIVLALEVVELQHWISSVKITSVLAYVPGYVLAALVTLGIFKSSEYSKNQKTIVLAALGVFIIPFHFPLVEITSPFIYGFFTIVTLSLTAIFLASLHARRGFQWFLFYIGIRFLVFYFQALGGLAATGFGLIVSGMLILGMAALWHKYRKPLEIWAERNMQ